MDDDDSEHRDNGWYALDSAFKDDPYLLSRHQIDSFDRFISEGLPQTLRDTKTISMVRDLGGGKQVTAEVFIGHSKVSVDVPVIESPPRPMYPNDARLRDLTYGVNLYADIAVEYRSEDGQLIGGAPVTFDQPACLGMLPLMVHSRYCALHGLSPDALREIGECPDDRGGYFVIDGKEKVIVAQEEIVNNRTYVRRGEASMPDIAWLSYIRNDSESDRFPRTTTLYVRANDAPSWPGVINVVVTHLGQVRTGVVGGSSLRGEIPLFVLFRVLGIESDKDILKHVVYDIDAPDVKDIIEFLRPSAMHAAVLGIRDQRSAIQRLMSHVPEGDDLKHVLVKDFFPNMGSDFRAKALFLGHVVAETIKVVLGKGEAANRDDYVNKRLHVSGRMLGDLFRDVYLRIRGDITARLSGEWTSGAWRTTGDVRQFINDGNLGVIFGGDRLTERFKASMKGQWGPDGGAAVSEDDGSDRGKVQDLSRISFLSYVSHVRRVSQTLPPGAKLDEPRKLRASQWGALCPVESPDGGNIGLMNHLTVLARVSLGSSAAAAREVILSTGFAKTIESFMSMSVNSLQAMRGVCKVLVNDTWFAMTHDPPSLVKALKAARASKRLDREASIAWLITSGLLHVHVDQGRFLRPLAVVARQSSGSSTQSSKPDPPPLPLAKMLRRSSSSSPPTWSSLFEMSEMSEMSHPLEYVDVEELRTLMVAGKPSDIVNNPLTCYTHCELQPAAALLSLSACTIPLMQHNKAPRNVFALAQFKQAIGMYSTAFNSRMDTHAYVLLNLQRPLVTTAIADRLCHNNSKNSNRPFANGQNLVVAVLTYSGYNMEDSIIINKGSVDRGRLHISAYSTHRFQEEIDATANVHRIFANPLDDGDDGDASTDFRVDKGSAHNPYRNIGPDGIPVVGSWIGENDVLIGMVELELDLEHQHLSKNSKKLELEQRESEKEKKKDRSVLGGAKHTGIVDAVAVFESASNNATRTRTCKVRLREDRPPQLGDKLASRYAQKGVLGLLLPEQDMPFCATSGIVPDLIINPHGFPSRDTASHLIESVLGKAAAVRGCVYQCNPFEREFDSIAEARTRLEAFGLDGSGNEVMVNTRTGDQIECDIFVGVNYYGRLKHMVADKIQARSRGAVGALVRQPTKSGGRSSGMRIGEMEQNSVCAHGMASFLKESFHERSDGYHMRTAAAAALDGGPCDEVGLNVPYAFKLLHQELAAMCINAELHVDRNHLDDDDNTTDEEAEEREAGTDDSDADADADADAYDSMADVDMNDLLDHDQEEEDKA